MLNDATCFQAVYIVCGYTDLRSGIDRLAAILETQTGNKPYRSLRLQSNLKAKRIILFVDARAIMHIYGILYQIHRELNSPASIHTKG